MTPSHKRLIKRALADGFSVSLRCPEEGSWDLKRSVSYKDIIEGIEAVDEIEAYLIRGNEKIWVYIVLDYGEEDTINDHTDCPYMSALAEEGVI